MLNSGKRFRALCDKKNILTLVLSEKKNSERNKKTITSPPPFKLNGRFLRLPSQHQHTRRIDMSNSNHSTSTCIPPVQHHCLNLISTIIFNQPLLATYFLTTTTSNLLLQNKTCLLYQQQILMTNFNPSILQY